MTMSFNRAKSLLDDIDESDYEPNEWEQSFLESIRELVEKRWTLTDGQAEKLQQIAERADEA